MPLSKQDMSSEQETQQVGRELSSELIESPAGDRQLSSELAESPIDAGFMRMINWYSYSSWAVDGGWIN